MFAKSWALEKTPFPSGIHTSTGRSRLERCDTLMSVSSLFLELLADLLDDFIKDVDDIFVSSIAVSRARANCCVISKLCPGSDDTGFTDCPVQENGREDIVEESRGRCPDPKETEDHQQVLCRIWQTDEFE